MADSSANIPVPRLQPDVAALAGIAVLFVTWFLAVEPVIVRFIGVFNVPRWMLISRGALAILVALVFTLRGSWRANGFFGGLQFKLWWLLCPFWLITLVNLPYAIETSTPLGHGQWLLASFVNAFVEEAAFRGVVLRALDPLGARHAITISALLFSLPHLPWDFASDDWLLNALVFGSWAFIAGILFAWARIATGSIWPGLIAHGCVDYAIVTARGGLHTGISLNFDAVATTIWIVTGGWACLLMRHSDLLRANAGQR